MPEFGSWRKPSLWFDVQQDSQASRRTCLAPMWILNSLLKMVQVFFVLLKCLGSRSKSQLLTNPKLLSVTDQEWQIRAWKRSWQMHLQCQPQIRCPLSNCQKVIIKHQYFLPQGSSGERNCSTSSSRGMSLEEDKGPKSLESIDILLSKDI